MANGFKVLWTEHALRELSQTFDYLEATWTSKELRNLATAIRMKQRLIANNPYLFPIYDIKLNVRKVVVSQYNTMYYRIRNGKIEVISFFSNRQAPENRDFQP